MAFLNINITSAMSIPPSSFISAEEGICGSRFIACRKHNITSAISIIPSLSGSQGLSPHKWHTIQNNYFLVIKGRYTDTIRTTNGNCVTYSYQLNWSAAVSPVEYIPIGIVNLTIWYGALYYIRMAL